MRRCEPATLWRREDDADALSRGGFYAGVGFVTAATLMLQIVETEIIFITSWYHLAFFVISIAMFGLTAGAVWVYLRRESFGPDELSYDLSVASSACARHGPGAALPADDRHERTSVVDGLVVWVAVRDRSVAAVLLRRHGVSLALTRSPYPVGIVYGVRPVRGSAWVPRALVLLNLVSGPSAALWIAALAAAGGLLFGAKPGGAPRPSTIGAGFASADGVFGALCVLALPTA